MRENKDLSWKIKFFHGVCKSEQTGTRGELQHEATAGSIGSLAPLTGRLAQHIGFSFRFHE
jgi:hypothetical protein